MLTRLLCIFSLGCGTAFAACNSGIIPVTPNSRFIDHANGTVTDTRTGFMWRRCPEGYSLDDGGTATDRMDDSCVSSGGATYFQWQSALQQATNANATGGYAGYTDWRVPNLKELASIIEYACFSPAINDEIFPAPNRTRFWSSTSFTGTASPVSALIVNFEFGHDQSEYKTNNSYLRLVRNTRD